MFEVLAEAHSVGVHHRDIKPANIFLHKEQGQEIVKVLDFGIAQLTDGARTPSATMTSQDDITGTLYYMSPEQMSGGACDGRTDVYSAGVMFYEMLTGQLPFLDFRQVIATGRQAFMEPPAPPSKVNSAVPAAFDAVVLSALVQDQAQRPTAIEFLAAAA